MCSRHIPPVFQYNREGGVAVDIQQAGIQTGARTRLRRRFSV
jgi:hypothetical protein